jgi:hypothetical protein
MLPPLIHRLTHPAPTPALPNHCSHDVGLPKWFDEDERKFMRPQAQVRRHSLRLRTTTAWQGLVVAASVTLCAPHLTWLVLCLPASLSLPPLTQITPEEYRAAREDLRSINTRPIKKVAEAQARKRKRLTMRLTTVRSAGTCPSLALSSSRPPCD